MFLYCCKVTSVTDRSGRRMGGRGRRRRSRGDHEHFFGYFRHRRIQRLPSTSIQTTKASVKCIASQSGQSLIWCAKNIPMEVYPEIQKTASVLVLFFSPSVLIFRLNMRIPTWLLSVRKAQLCYFFRCI